MIARPGPTQLIVLATVAFLLPLHTNLLSQAGITHYSQLLILQHSTKLLCKKQKQKQKQNKQTNKQKKKHYTPSGKKKNYSNEWMNEWMNEKPQKCVSNVLAFLSKPERTFCSLTPQLETVIIEIPTVQALRSRANPRRLHGAMHLPSMNWT